MPYNSYLTVFKWVYGRLQPFRKKQFWILFICMFLVASFETITLGSVAFFASAVTDPVNILSSKYVDFIKQIINADFLNSAKDLIIASGLLMCIMMAIKNSLRIAVDFGVVRFSGSAEVYFGNILLNGFLKLPYQWHLSQNSADLINAMEWRPYLGRSFFRPCLAIFNDILTISIMLITIFVIQPAISFFILLVLGSSALFIYKVIKYRIDKASTIAREYQLTIHKETSMSIQGIKDVKICGCEDVFISKYLNNATPFSKIFGIQTLYGALPVRILETVGFGMLFLSICIMLLKLDITTAYMTGIMALLAVTAWRVLPAVSQVVNNFSGIRKILPYMRTLIDYITLIETNDAKNKRAIEQVSSFRFVNNIKFENVCFSYQVDGLEIIRDLNFKINKGETIGIIGTSGSGKSTLVDLIIGLLKPVKGTIYIDHQVLSNENLTSWLKITGYVPQSPYIYDQTLAENIAFGVDYENIDRSLIRKCCTMASMDDFVHNLNDNIDSFIGERGIKLSGGQQQRVAIARALYRKPEVMIFDEATSSLDTKSEKSIKETIYSFKGKQTLIIVAHRLSTVEDCDKIIWMDKGKIKMIGKAKKIIKEYRKNIGEVLC